MRIGFDAHVLDGRSQGTKTMLLRIVDVAARRHPEHDFFVYSEQPHPELDFSLGNLTHRPTHRRNVADYLLRAMPRAAREDRLDTMVFNYIQSPLMRNATVIIHDILPQTDPRLFPLTFVLQCWVFFGVSSAQAGTLLTVSDYSRREIQRVYPWTRRRPIRVLHNGASFPHETYFASDDGEPLPARLEKGQRYVLMVGRIEARKNVQLAIDAFRRGAPDDVTLVIVGRREPGVTIDDHGDPRVRELVGITDAELVNLYRRADLFLYPSIAEGFGLPLLDAILFGLPVLSSERTSMKEVGDGCAEFFDPGMADAERWLGDRIAAHFSGAPVARPDLAARHRKAALYSWATAADELVDAIVTGARS